MGNYIGIDFGTTNSVLSAFDGKPKVLLRDDNDLMPSAVAVRADGTLVIGHEARLIYNGRNGIESIKRKLGRYETVVMGGKEYRSEEIASLIFAKLKGIAEDNLGEPVSNVVITVPANSKGMQRHATAVAAGLAGLNAIALINEPTAAAMAYGLDAGEEKVVLVYDFGGGTFDVTVLRIHRGVFEELSSKGVGRLGGYDIDEILLNYLIKAYEADGRGSLEVDLGSLGEARHLMEQAKIRLSTEEKATVWLEKAGYRLFLDRGTFQGLIGDLVERTRESMNIALSDAGIDKDGIDAVLLVGGTSKIPYVREFVAGYFGRDIVADGVDPMTCVAQGAAIAAALMQDAEGMEDYAYSVKLEHSLCSDVYSHETDELYLEPIIERGRDIPCKDTKTFYPVSDYAPSVQITIYEGDVYDDPEDDENVALGTLDVNLNPPRRASEVPIDVTFRYSADGIVSVTAVDRKKKKSFDKVIRYNGTTLTEAELAALRELTTQRLMESREYPDAAFALRRATTVVKPVLDADGDEEALKRLADLCGRLLNAMDSEDQTLVDEATEDLNADLDQYSYLF